jgi:hypothetical protein
MSEARVVSSGPLALVDGFRGEAVAMSASSAYLSGPDRRLVVIHDAKHGHTPTSLLVDDARPLSWGVEIGDSAVGRLGRLQIGPLLLDARHQRVWQPPSPRPRSVDPAAIQPLLNTAGEAGRRLLPACLRLRSAIDTGNDVLVASCLRTLIGSGPGATPSGDDALVGLLAVLHRVWLPERSSGPLSRLRALVPQFIDRTTIISAHYLLLALAGHFGEHLTNLVDGYGGGDGDDSARVARVGETGATSGRDTLVGVAIGLELHARQESADRLEVDA